jgi:nucleoid-associated protein YgaU
MYGRARSIKGGDTMGLFQFIKDAGAKLLGLGSSEPTADALKKEVAGHGFDASGLNIDVQGDKVKLSGKAMTQEEAEKIILALGNTVGIAEVDTNGLVVAAAAAESTMYTVKKGDTLWKIAEMHYGKGKGAKYTEIVKANSPPVKNPDLIQPGWVLRIPPQS